MAKKKQQDFQKTKLRVGHSLPKGRNDTDTSFSSNKILVRQDIAVHQPNSSGRDVDDFVKGLNRNNIHTLVRVLNQCRNLEQNTLVTDYISYLHRVLDLTYDIEHGVRISAINALRYILAFTTDAKLANVFSLLTKSLSCAMTHTNFEVRQDSLVMFDAILSSHPGLLWTHKIFLNHLLGMISQTHSSIDTRKRRKTLDDSLNEEMTGQAWRMKVLAQMNNFLEVILKNLMKKENDTDNENEVHYQGKPMFIPIYAGGGLKPIDIESPDHCLKSPHCYWKDEVIRPFAFDLVPLITRIFIEEILQFQDLPTKESLPSLANPQNLSTLLQVFHCLGKWIKSVPKPRHELEEWFSGAYGSVINTALMKHFPFGQKMEDSVGQASTSKKIKPPSNLELNLRICCLYSLFVLETQYSNPAMDKRISEYLEGVFAMSYEECFANIPFLVEITKNYLSCGDDEGIKCSFLKGLCGKFNPSLPSDSSQKELQAFFMELSLNMQYKNLAGTAEMKLWYSLLFDQLNKMMETNHMDKKFLKDIKKICCRQYPNFMDCLLDIEPKEYLKLLKCENEDFQETVVCLIYHRKCLPPEFLQDIAETILLNPSFSFRTASRIIVMLAHRFSSTSVPNVDQVLCAKFLLNIACDTVCMDDIPQNCEEIMQFMVGKFKSMHSFFKFEILPSLGWEKHSKLYEVCINSLKLFPETRKSLSIPKFLKQVLERVTIPLHSAIAILKLKTDFLAFIDISNDIDLNSAMHELVFSSLVYASLLSSYGAGWQKYGIPELPILLDVNRQTVFETIRHMKSEAILYNADFAYLCLRICGYFITHKLLVPDDKMEIIPLLKHFKVFCSENADYSEYFVNVCNYFGYCPGHPLVIKSV